MPAYVIGQIHVRDSVGWQAYVSQVGATIAAHGGEMLFRARRERVMNGDSPFERVVVIRFTDRAAADRWHDSPDYQRLIPIRDAAADVTLVTYES